MAKNIILGKLLIFQDSNGNLGDAILQYKIETDGVTPKNSNSISVKSAIGEENLNAMLVTAINAAKQSEGIE